MTERTLAEKHEQLQRILGKMKSVAVAFSAGVDSTVLLKVAVDVLGAGNVTAVTGRSPSLAPAELDQARDLTASIGVEHVVVDTREFDNPEYCRNPANRCYLCKSALYDQMKRLIEKRGIDFVVAGTNADDLSDYRPGIDAGRDFGVRAPVAEAGLDKKDLRDLARQLGLSVHDKPASPCLASRIPYGEAITPEKLRAVEAAETFLRRMGIRECRVRHHDTVARIEVPGEFIPLLAEAENAARVDRYLRSLGYQYVALDLRGFRSGSLNEVLAIDTRAGEPKGTRRAGAT